MHEGVARAHSPGVGWGVGGGGGGWDYFYEKGDKLTGRALKWTVPARG